MTIQRVMDKAQFIGHIINHNRMDVAEYLLPLPSDIINGLDKVI